MARSKSNSALYRKILDALREGPLSTGDLSSRLGEDPTRIYRYCRQLEKLGLASSDLEPGRRLLFCTDDLTVVTSENYDDHKDHELRSFFGKMRLWRLVTRAGKGRQLALRLGKN